MPLVTTLQRRDNEVCLADFESVRSFDFHCGLPQDSQIMIDLWNEYIPYTPNELSKVFKTSTSQHLHVSVLLCRRSDFRFVLHASGADGLTKNYITEQTYHMSGRSVESGNLQLSKEEQGRSIGRRISTEFIDLNVALGIQKFKFSAELDAGGYVWAKMGYYLDIKNVRGADAIKNLSENILSKLKILKELITPDTYEKAKEYAKLKNPDDLYHLTRLEEDISGSVLEDDFFDQKTGSLFQVLKREGFVSDSDFTDHYQLVFNMKEAIRFCKKRGKPLTIGKLSLAGERWPAYANYNNDIQMQGISDYVGGFKCSKIVPDKSVSVPSEVMKHKHC